MVDRDVFLVRGLQRVGAGHEPRERVLAIRDRCGDLRRQLVRRREPLLQRDDVGLALLDVADELPLPGLAGLERCLGTGQVTAALAACVRLPRGRDARAEGVELRVAEQHRGAVETKREHRVGAQRLGGLGPVRDGRVEREAGEPRVRVEFRPLVGVDEVAGVGLREARCAGWQQVHEPVDEIDLRGLVAAVLQRALAHEAERVAELPAVAEHEAERVVHLLEAEAVAEHVLVERALDRRVRVPVWVERLPLDGAAALLDTHERAAARAPGAVVDLVDRDVRKQRGLGRDATRGQAAVRGGEQPVIRMRDDADEERRHAVDVVNRVVALAEYVDELARDAAVDPGRLECTCRGHGPSHPPRVLRRRTGWRRSSRGPWARRAPTRTR